MSNSLEIILKHAGLNLSSEEIAYINPYFDLYREALKQLYDAPLENYALANTFIASTK